MKAQELSKQYLEFGEPDRALLLLREIANLDPEDTGKYSNYLYTMHFAKRSPEEIFHEHLLFSQKFEKKVFLPPYTKRPGEKIRIGYISPDLYAQASRYCLEPITANHNKELFEIYFYNNSPSHDEYTERFKSHADSWREIQVMDAHNIVRGIRNDKIDILVDLSGHTGLNNLSVFMLRAAPIQISWFGYMDTTGLINIDYRFTDEWRIPHERTPFYTEKLIYLPNSYSFIPYENLPPITPLPMLRNGHATFGSLNSSQKINAEVIELWAEVLRAVPDSKLLIVCPRIDEYVQKLFQKFQAYGIDPSRIIPRPRTTMPEFIAYINDIDIALDPFPYTGGITTYHALSMGVPTITLEGTTEFERNCSAIMHEAGIASEAVALTKGEYVGKAVALSRDPSLLALFRQTLPGELKSREKNTVKNVENAFLDLLR